MAFGDFLEGPFLRGVFTLLVLGVLFRVVLCAIGLLRERNAGEPGRVHGGTGFLRSLLPFHSGIPRKPFSAALHYVFHICVIAVPVWLSGHIALWEQSVLQWSWGALPDAWADALTLLVLVLCALFLARRLVLTEVRKDSSFSDYALIVLAGLPFLSGYFLSHAGPGSGGDGLRIFHVVTGCAFLILVVFLFVETRLKEGRCTACASCVIRCPGGALECRDEGELRVLEHTPFRCILCGGCVAVCPENAAGLRHRISLSRLVRRFGRERLLSREVGRCRGCGEPLGPLAQVEEVRKKLSQEYVYYCERCKRERVARQKLAPLWGEASRQGGGAV
jgi:ferredoxin